MVVSLNKVYERIELGYINIIYVKEIFDQDVFLNPQTRKNMYVEHGLISAVENQSWEQVVEKEILDHRDRTEKSGRSRFVSDVFQKRHIKYRKYFAD